MVSKIQKKELFFDKKLFLTKDCWRGGEGEGGKEQTTQQKKVKII